MLEHEIQSACIRWFRYSYPTLKWHLWAIPNGAYKSKLTAGKFKEEGLLSGVSDLMLSLPRQSTGEHGLFIELKTAKGKVSETQKEFMKHQKEVGYRCEVIRSLEEFINLIEDYLCN